MDNALKSWSTTLLLNTERENAIDKVILPNSVLEALISKNSTLPSPLTFVLVNKRNNVKIYSGVSEFTAEENEIYMSNTMKNALDAENYEEIFIRIVELPKCQEVKLKAMSTNVSKISNIKALLESYFRKEQTLLYAGQEINVVDWQESYKFIVKELKPEIACIVIDTDVEVDIEPYEGDAQDFKLDNKDSFISKNNNNKIIELPITLKSQSTSNKINYTNNNGMIKQFTIEKDDNYYYKVKIPLHSYISIQLTILQGDINLYYSFNVEKPDIHNCIGCNVDSTKQRNIIISTEKNVDNFIYFSIQGYQEKNEFEISVQEVDKVEEEIDIDETSSSNNNEENEKKNDPNYTLCDHCHQYIPNQSFTLHSAFCARNNMICEKCGKSFSRAEFPDHWHCDIEDNFKCQYAGHTSDKEKHQKMFHTPILCDCGITLPLPEMIEHHRSEQCPERQIICRYCKLKVKAGNTCTNLQDVLKGLCEHEAECGSRTVVCQQCHASVQMKNIQVHGQLHIIEKKKPPIILCTNKNCSHYKDKKFKNMTSSSPNSINYLSPETKGLCATCYGLFWSPRHEMTDAYLSQGILKQYHKQLTVGCGKEFCMNKYCCTSKDPTISKPMNPTESALLSLELTKKALKSRTKPDFNFCVFEKRNAEQRQLANEFLVPLGYSIEWCIKALVTVQKQELEKEDDLEDSYSSYLPEKTPEQIQNELLSKSIDWLKINALPIDK